MVYQEYYIFHHAKCIHREIYLQQYAISHQKCYEFKVLYFRCLQVIDQGTFQKAISQGMEWHMIVLFLYQHVFSLIHSICMNHYVKKKKTLLSQLCASKVLLHLIQPCVHGIIDNFYRSTLYYSTSNLFSSHLKPLHSKDLSPCTQHLCMHHWIHMFSHVLDSPSITAVSILFLQSHLSCFTK